MLMREGRGRERERERELGWELKPISWRNKKTFNNAEETFPREKDEKYPSEKN